MVFHVRPVFAVLNTKTLSLFDNEHVTNLYRAITLDHVTHTMEEPELTLSKIWCFDVYRGPKKDESGTQPLIQLCAETQEKMESWSKAIEIFDECEVKLQQEDGTEDSEQEGPEVRQLKRNSIANANKKIADLEAEAQKEEENRNKNKQMTEEEMSKLRGKLGEIRANMKKKNIEEQRERLYLIEKRKKMAQLNKFLHEEEDCLTADLEKKAQASEVTSEGLIKLQEENQLNDILDKTNKDMMSEADKARLAITGQEVDLTEAERDMQERLKHMMVQETMVFDMIMDSSVCYSDDLFYNPLKHIQDTCAGFLEPGKIPDLGVINYSLLSTSKTV